MGMPLCIDAAFHFLSESAKGRGEEDIYMANVSELCTKTLVEVAELIKKKEVSPVELTQAMLNRISALDGKLYSYLTVTTDLALQQARTSKTSAIRKAFAQPVRQKS